MMNIKNFAQKLNVLFCKRHTLDEQDWAQILAYAWLHEESVEYDGEIYPSFGELLQRDPRKGIDYLKTNVPQFERFKKFRTILIIKLPPAPYVTDPNILIKVAEGDKEVLVIPDGFVRLVAPTLEGHILKLSAGLGVNLP